MSLLVSMLPVYFFGNFHCAGMCGPLVFLLGRHQNRYMYFLGRCASFTLAGALAGSAGQVLDLVVAHFYLPAIVSLLFAFFLILLGAATLLRYHLPGQRYLTARVQKAFSVLMQKKGMLPIFLIGFFTVFLPCGQTLLVFSACALSGGGAEGTVNGLAFALLTTPSLFLAMHAQHFFHWGRRYYNQIVGVLAIFVGVLALLRGLADLGIIEHWVLSSEYHIVLF